MVKILLIAGHGAGDPGACSPYGVERDEARTVLSIVKNGLSYYDCMVDVYPLDRNCYADIKSGHLKVNFALYDYVFEIHFNSVGNDQAQGTEIWVTPSEANIDVENRILNYIVEYGYPNRGVKRENFCVIRNAKAAGASAALIETCFISSGDDMFRFRAYTQKTADAMVCGMVDGFGLKLRSEHVPTPPPVVNPPVEPEDNDVTKLFYVKDKEGKQLGAFKEYSNAVATAKTNKAAVYNYGGAILVNFFEEDKCPHCGRPM